MKRRVTAATVAIVLLACPLVAVSFVVGERNGSFVRCARPEAKTSRGKKPLPSACGCRPTYYWRRQNASLLLYSRYDNLVAGVAEISLGTSIGVLWSEFAVLTTGCGPLHLSDTLERFCYQAVVVAAGVALFFRIATGKDVVALCQDVYGELQDFTLVQVRAAELLLVAAVFGAFVALGSQMINGQHMDGMSGINVQMCRAIQDL